MLITKDHMIDMIGVNTPGVGNYKPIVRNTFEEVKIKNEITDKFRETRNQSSSLGKSIYSLGNASRFASPSSNKWRGDVPVGYATIDSKIGKVTQAKEQPKITDLT